MYNGLGQHHGGGHHGGGHHGGGYVGPDFWGWGPNPYANFWNPSLSPELIFEVVDEKDPTQKKRLVGKPMDGTEAASGAIVALVVAGVALWLFLK